ncbi:lysophospholipase, putative [Plasmodium chabaudi chabaudi]|uniref:Lysophospholipase, putative n=1 Tax=Plasmodium chabaudi chabaudi TaxID=31271 RepID=A0A4V0K8Q5_PLACU|nr:lysophospholipase, putative [Plasmodium chabaudi chabaudi]VTZ68607.1 lysophospholipase, putative [Plasmodium chabaudi chabaudi]|eukprot:XP_732850.2 lysophospholipase, putative [Plasmodium chabaudi chabaudi]
MLYSIILMMEEIELNNDELRSTTLRKLDGDPKVGWLCNKNGLLLKTYRWLANNAAGIILLIHGYRVHTRLTFMRTNLKMPDNNEDLAIDSNNCYIYKDSWIEKFNQNGYSVYAVDLQGHGESQGWKNVRGDFSSFDDLVDDVIQYMNHIQDEISNENQTDDESHDIVTTKKKKLPVYIIGYSMGGNIALRMLQILRKEKEDRIKAWNSNNYKNDNTMLNNSTNINENENDMNNANDYDSDNSCASTSTTKNVIASDKDEGFYNCLDKFNIKGCVSLSGMIRIKLKFDPGNKSFKYFYLPLAKFLSFVLPHIVISSEPRYKKSGYFSNICKRYIFRNINGKRYKNISEFIKTTVALDCNINYMPKDIPLLFVHSKDDNICSYEWTVSFYNKVEVNKKDLHPVDGMNHDTTTNPGNEEILKAIIDWISDVRSNCEDEIEDE